MQGQGDLGEGGGRHTGQKKKFQNMLPVAFPSARWWKCANKARQAVKTAVDGGGNIGESLSPGVCWEGIEEIERKH